MCPWWTLYGPTVSAALLAPLVCMCLWTSQQLVTLCDCHNNSSCSVTVTSTGHALWLSQQQFMFILCGWRKWHQHVLLSAPDLTHTTRVNKAMHGAQRQTPWWHKTVQHSITTLYNTAIQQHHTIQHCNSTPGSTARHCVSFTMCAFTSVNIDELSLPTSMQSASPVLQNDTCHPPNWLPACFQRLHDDDSHVRHPSGSVSELPSAARWSTTTAPPDRAWPPTASASLPPAGEWPWIVWLMVWRSPSWPSTS